MRSLNRWVRQPHLLFWTAGGISILLSLLAFFRMDAINPDGICYLQSAATVLQQHTLALHLCDQSGWPFYQVLIAGVSGLSGWSVMVSAGVLNAVLSALSVLMFVATVCLLTPNVRIRLWAVAVILMSHHFNAFRADIIRDHGYWAFYLMSVVALLRCVTVSDFPRRFLWALLWAFTLTVATLFRIEGVFFLVLCPFVVFVIPRKKIRWRTATFFSLNALLLLILPVAVFWLILHPAHSLGRLDYLGLQITHGWQILHGHWHQVTSAMVKVLSPFSSAEDAAVVLGTGLFGYYLLGLFDVLTPVYFVLIAYALWRRLPGISGVNARVLAVYIVVNVAVTLFFLAQNFFLARRYLMGLSLILMFWLPFALEDLVRQWRVRRWPLLLAVFLMMVCALGGVWRFGPSHQYVRRAGEWLSVHASSKAAIYSNDRTVLYYAGCGNSVFVPQPSPASIEKNELWRRYDWIALNVNPKTEINLPFVPVQVFSSARGGEIRIYRLKKEGLS